MWEPILDGNLAARAWRAVRDIADALEDEPAPDLALFWTYASASLDDEHSHERHDAALEHFAEHLGTPSADLGLHGGLAGLGWVAAHVAEGVDELLDDVDQILIDALSDDLRYDLVSGPVGFAVYFLERAASSQMIGLRAIVEHLASRCERSDQGSTWHTPPVQLLPHDLARYPDGYYNCGLAHGVPGAIAVLAKIASRDDAPKAAGELRDEAVRWLLAQRLGDGGFPRVAGGPPARTAWCYGDPGVSFALAHANLPRAELDPILRWTTRSTNTGIRDAGLCHGTAGLAHLCNRLYQASRAPAHRDAARAWFERTLAYRRPGEGIGGFVMEQAGEPIVTATLLEGAAGVGLALLGALAPIEPLWDRLLLCDLPVR